MGQAALKISRSNFYGGEQSDLLILRVADEPNNLEEEKQKWKSRIGRHSLFSGGEFEHWLYG